jgi:hypothetical protein
MKLRLRRRYQLLLCNLCRLMLIDLTGKAIHLRHRLLLGHNHHLLLLPRLRRRKIARR